MKSLMKIIRRYVVSAAVLVLTVAFFNIAMLYFIGWQSLQKYGESRLYAGEQLETVVGEFSAADQGTAENTVQYQLSEQGYAYLEECGFLWSMLLDEEGNVVWDWRLPAEIPRSYGLADVAKFSRWYLMDYPVRVWEMDGMLLVSGYGKDHAVKINLMYPLWQIQSFPRYLSIAVGMNVFQFSSPYFTS